MSTLFRPKTATNIVIVNQLTEVTISVLVFLDTTDTERIVVEVVLEEMFVS